jgi:hypothetical protein
MLAACEANQPDPQTTELAAKTSALSASAQTVAGSAITEAEAKATMAAAGAKAAAHKAADLPTTLAGIQKVDGRARQELIMEYMEAADQLPKADHDKAVQQLAGLWKK